MREIKFRAWDRVQNVMRGWDWLEEKQGTYLNSKYFHAMQYTGLKDKNGKEIYEGDIFDFGYPVEVFWDSGSWALKTKIGTTLLCGDVYDGVYDGEVLGNIYENPELIKTI